VHPSNIFILTGIEEQKADHAMTSLLAGGYASRTVIVESLTESYKVMMNFKGDAEFYRAVK